MTVDRAVKVVFGADRSYAMALAVALRSLADHSNGVAPTVFVLHDGFDVDLQRKIERSCEPLRPEWITVPEQTIAELKVGLRLPHSSHYTILVPRFVPAEVSRVVHLDADILVRRALTDLWATELGGHAFAAAHDAFLPTLAAGLPWRRLELDPRAPYFNAGVMVMDLAAWRDAEISERAMRLLGEDGFPKSDQSALNALAAGGWQPLDPAWNVQSHYLTGDASRAWAWTDRDLLERAIADPGIVHFCHGDFARPWQADSSHPYRDAWLATLDRTPWAGWRPRRHWTAGALRRVRRAGRVLAGRP